MNTKQPRNYTLILVILFTISAVYWILGNVIQVYKNGIVGAIFEILWAPMLAVFALTPIISLTLWFTSKQKGTPIKPYLIFGIISGVVVVAALTA